MALKINVGRSCRRCYRTGKEGISSAQGACTALFPSSFILLNWKEGIAREILRAGSMLEELNGASLVPNVLCGLQLDLTP